jgi:hypothetical protein
MKWLIVFFISVMGVSAYAAFEDDNPAKTQAGSVNCPDGNCYSAVESKPLTHMSREEVLKLAEALLEKHETPKLPIQGDGKALKEGR